MRRLGDRRLLDKSPTNLLEISQVADRSTRELVNSPTASFENSRKDRTSLYTKPKPNLKPSRLSEVLKQCNLREITFRVIVHSIVNQQNILYKLR